RLHPDLHSFPTRRSSDLALYNMATRDHQLADAIARAIVALDLALVLFAPDKSALARAGEAEHLRVAREVFADRNYLADGSLVPRDRKSTRLNSSHLGISY